ncbi:BZ3500_MvSof-1268-A1-R1_Chr11-1g03169 [Microbotryum saponariae]|uniref:BZ3500_MvSof-1268-A1-R1_Chr11-1g03169 protein n=1 Tax=Microbotryum saponariae TaxID=289078 RepID=A0A2X0LD96_9BASI|nr:BZ3501_MvSof-1269-A2-R1_Chr11g02744 [Microbotryum saponariae]SDA03729.1 BZ3500_MvSof-1268-A1-R1_Chr11-1g03169 [Microbotryum saponariae]
MLGEHSGSGSSLPRSGSSSRHSRRQYRPILGSSKTGIDEEAKIREQQTTTRLSAERAQAQPDAKLPLKPPPPLLPPLLPLRRPLLPPKVDVDALFAGKLKELEAGPLASQQPATQAAVTEALAGQATENEARVATRTDDGAQEDGRDQAQSVRCQAQGPRTDLSRRTGTPLPDTNASLVAVDSAPSSPALAPAPAAAPATPTLALKATSPARGGAAAGRGAIGRRGKGRGAAAAGASPSRPGAATASEIPSKFSIRGIMGTAAAPATPPASTPGGVLGRLMGGALGGKTREGRWCFGRMGNDRSKAKEREVRDGGRGWGCAFVLTRDRRAVRSDTLVIIPDHECWACF